MDAPVIMAALPPRLALPGRAGDGEGVFQGALLSRDSTAARAWFTNSLNYYLAALFFNAFPLPQREAGARQTLRYIGDVLDEGYSVLIFPEGRRSETGEIDAFRPGIGMIASRLGVPVVPVRIEGLDRCCTTRWRMARPGRVRVAFGAPLRWRRRLRGAGERSRTRSDDSERRTDSAWLGVSKQLPVPAAC